MTTVLPFTPEVARETEPLWERLKTVVPRFEWEMKAPLVAAINRLKRERRAVILGHNYMVPEIFHGISDFTGDSLELARRARDTDAAIILFCGVHFMAETAKILNPGRTVLIPDLEAGCSLSESITAEDVRHPGVPVVAYVNTPAAIKAEVDVCCTSANAVQVVESLGVDEVLFLPDEYLARNVARKTKVKVTAWKGRCIVHEQFTVEMLESYRAQFPGIEILAHPECSPEVCAAADFVGSTKGMIDRLDRPKSGRVILITECSMADNVQGAHPELEFVKTCTLCPHMKRITLEKVLASLTDLKHEILLEEGLRLRALRSVERMLALPVPARADADPGE
ncbi:MAG: quinolinate synthase NadA [Planctomycetes bacterium]|nr:quinolinate synthase NadA [Planctomycetota bacterium]